MQTIILAAGKGTRMQEYEKSIPKPMLELAPKKPILSCTLDVLPEEVNEIIMIVNHLKGQIQEFFKDEYKGKKITYVEQKELNGSGAAVHVCKDMVNDSFLVVNGDDIYHPGDVKKVVEHPGYCMLVYEIKDPKETRGGVVQLDKQGNIEDIVDYPENPKSLIINTGLYKLEKSFFDYPLERIKEGHPEFGLPQTLVNITRDHPIKAIFASFWQMVNTPEDLGKARAVFPKIKEELGL